MTNFLNRVEFYITNVCNYNCEHCNRFNNYHFTGQQKWDEYKDVYSEWGNKLDVDYISILGGEPLLNPDITKWISGVRQIWNKATIEIVTNGTRLDKVKGLYDAININEKQTFVHIGLHSRKLIAGTIDTINNFLDGPTTINTIYPDDINTLWEQEYNRHRNNTWPERPTLDEYNNLPNEIKNICKENNFDKESFLLFNSITEVKDSNGVRVEIHIEDIFHRSALTRNGNKFSVHDSDPNKAHAICFEKHNHHFLKGKLYKCNVTSVLPEFYKQFNFDISDEDTALMHSYKPLLVTDNDETFANFIKELPNKVSQCKFCPEWLHSFNLNPSTQKIKIEKRHR